MMEKEWRDRFAQWLYAEQRKESEDAARQNRIFLSAELGHLVNDALDNKPLPVGGQFFKQFLEESRLVEEWERFVQTRQAKVLELRP